MMFYKKIIRRRSTMYKLEKIRELKFRRGFVRRAKTSGQKQACESPNDSIREKIAFQ
jgi:hypothetical protein